MHNYYDRDYYEDAYDDEFTEDDYYDYLFEDVTAHADDYINDDATIIERID